MKFINNSPYAKLARKSLEHFLQTGKIWDLSVDFSGTQAAAFVSIRKHDQNRGCYGTFAKRPNIGLEIIYNAIHAGIRDDRFWPVKLEEFEELTFSVDVLSKPELVVTNNLDPAEYGVIIHSGKKQAVLLPALPGINTVEQQIQTVKRKAKITDSDFFEIYRFITIRHLEE